MLKQHIQAVLKRLRHVFKKKSQATSRQFSNEKGEVASANAGQNDLAEKSADVTAPRSSSSKSSVKSKSSAQPADALQEGKEAVGSGSFEPARGSEDRESGRGRPSESSSVPQTMPQLPTILVGEDLEPLDLEPRRDSGQLPRDENNHVEQSNS
ncbi:hypothetical protein AX15_006165 [Amanita polypyramis BW_CC]|nr:hypothetical protein AX15_006165 [Amanita polypyramis BW_CC]